MALTPSAPVCPGKEVGPFPPAGTVCPVDVTSRLCRHCDWGTSPAPVLPHSAASGDAARQPLRPVLVDFWSAWRLLGSAPLGLCRSPGPPSLRPPFGGECFTDKIWAQPVLVTIGMSLGSFRAWSWENGVPAHVHVPTHPAPPVHICLASHSEP